MDNIFFSLLNKCADDIENIYIKFSRNPEDDFLSKYTPIPAIIDVSTKFINENTLLLVTNVINYDNNFNGFIKLHIFDSITDECQSVSLENIYSKRTIEISTTFKLIQSSAKKLHDIPKIIHQSYKGPLRVTNLKACQSWKYYNPSFEYKYWNDDDCRNLIKMNFSNDVFKVYDRLYAGAFKADIFRLCVLYLEGGIWADISTLCASPVGLLLSENINLVTAYDGPAQNDDFVGVIWQAFIVSPKGSPIIKSILDFTINKLLNTSNFEKMYPWFKNKNCIHGPLTVTGPFVFATALNSFMGRNPSDIFEENTYEGGIKIVSHDSKSLRHFGKKILDIKYPNFSKDRYNTHYSEYYKNGCIIKKEAANHIVDNNGINIYQIWIQSNIISENLLSNIQSWVRNYKDYNYILLTNTEIITMIKYDSEFPLLYNCYVKLKPYAYKSELIRFYLLYKNGGIYTDIQSRCINKYNGFDNHTDLCVFVDVITNLLSMSFIYSKKNNKFLKTLLMSICNNINESKYPSVETDLTGQTMFHKFFLTYYGFQRIPEEGVYIKKEETIKVAFYNRNLPMPKGSWIDSARNYSVKKGNVLEADLLNTEGKWVGNSILFSLGDILINDNGRLKGATNTPLYKNILLYKEGLMLSSYNEYPLEREFLDSNNHHDLFKRKNIYI
jgi:mannosyltransferase OCH1-like enzyme